LRKLRGSPGTIILPVVLGQHRGRGPEYQLEEIVPRCGNIEKSVLCVTKLCKT
jgi:hypothetical protein